MKNLITAINNEKIYGKLKKEENVNVLCKDIQYKEGILEAINQYKKIDIIIINDAIPGDANIVDIIEKIKEKQNIVKIIVILETKDKEKELKLKSEDVFDIYYNDEIDADDLCKEIIGEFINNNEELKEEIKELKKIILDKEKTKKKGKLKIFQTKKEGKNFHNKKCKIISFSGTHSIGKSTISILISKLINNKKILLITQENKAKKILKNNKNIAVKNIEKIDINLLNNYRHKYELIIFDVETDEIHDFLEECDSNYILIEPDLFGIDKGIKIIKKYSIKMNIKNNKIKIIFNKCNLNSINEKILLKIFFQYKIISRINYNNIFTKIINNNFNNINNNLKILKNRELKKLINEVSEI